MKTKDEKYSSINNPELWDKLLPKSEISGELKTNLDELKSKNRVINILKLLKKLITSLGKKTKNRIHYNNNKLD